MKLPRLGRPSPAMIVALLALFVALGGGSYAAIKLKQNQVKSKNIAPDAVQSSDIASDAVQGVDANESSFAKVPEAAKADDAGTIDGVDSASLPLAFTGRAESANSQSDLIFSVPAMGVEIRDDPLGAVDSSAFQVKNVRAPGGGNVVVDNARNSDAFSSAPVAPGAVSAVILGKNSTSHGSPAFITDPANLGRLLSVWCELGVGGKITCLGLLKG